jgi:DNA repair exonuclease SbcCD ATPase subunit
MKRLSGLLLVAFLLLSPGVTRSQEMSALEASFRQQYEQFTMQIMDLQRLTEDLRGIKAQVDAIIEQIQSKRYTSYSQEADKYRQLEVLMPVAVRFSQDLEAKRSQIEQLVSKREAVKARLVEWRGTLPPWWVE